jgi:hypothetical protein
LSLLLLPTLVVCTGLEVRGCAIGIEGGHD